MELITVLETTVVYDGDAKSNLPTSDYLLANIHASSMGDYKSTKEAFNDGIETPKKYKISLRVYVEEMPMKYNPIGIGKRS